MAPKANARNFNVCTWSKAEAILVFGEAAAFITAMAGALVALATGSGVVTVVIGFGVAGAALCLLLYALDLVTRGETPLTKGMANRIKNVMRIYEWETRGYQFDWDDIAESGAVLPLSEQWFPEGTPQHTMFKILEAHPHMDYDSVKTLYDATTHSPELLDAVLSTPPPPQPPQG